MVLSKDDTAPDRQPDSAETDASELHRKLELRQFKLNRDLRGLPDIRCAQVATADRFGLWSTRHFAAADDCVRIRRALPFSFECERYRVASGLEWHER